ncbi:MAG TPA: carboxypeptidase-like regulatory domain-containing protein [Longimicrobium sp.]|nr:carboxypeptidase-like regulatory domain-containing protein [Longimicrobium sp.]
MRLLELLVALFAAGPLGAQTVRGVLVDEAARPVPSAIVALVYPGGSVSRGTMTNAQGRFTLVAALPGRYTVRAERTGYRTAEVVVNLGAGETVDVRLATAIQAFVLPTVDVVGESRCTVRPGRGMAAYTLWEEARKALNSAAYLQDAERVQYTVRTFRADIEMRTGRMRRQHDEPRRVTGRPFVTLSPAALAEGGYVRTEYDSVGFYGPDAQVLLSDEFLDTHCLYVDPNAADRMAVGLRFEPIRRRGRGVADIRGVLRIHRRTGELLSVEYEYTDLRGPNAQARAGGSVEFRRLANGAWVVTRWRIRTTNVARSAEAHRRGPSAQVVTDIREAGGEVTEIEVLPEPGPGASASNPQEKL